MTQQMTVKSAINDPRMMSQFKLALPQHITVERFVRIATTALANNPDLNQCSTQSVMNALLKCAQDGLLPDNKEAALVKFGSVAQYMPMVYGLIKRMRNSGDVTSVNAYIVYSNDEFQYEIVDGVQHFRHKPNITKDRGQKLLAYAVVSLKDASPHIEVMTRDEIEKARKASKTQKEDRPTGIWAAWEDEMWKKTVIHRAAKRVPTSADIESLLRSDMRVVLNGGEEENPPKGPSLVDSINSAIEVDPVQEAAEAPESPENTETQENIFPPDRK